MTRADGTVLDWYPTEGWDVLFSPEVEGTVFALLIDLPENQYRG
jgi:hypothetical protein